jgi:hypothetical protein
MYVAWRWHYKGIINDTAVIKQLANSMEQSPAQLLRWSINSNHFIEHEVLLSSFHELATCPYPG